MLALIKAYGDDIIYIVNAKEDKKKLLTKVANGNELRYNKSRKIKDLGAFNGPRELIKAMKNYMYIDKETSVLWPNEWVAVEFEVKEGMELPRGLN